ncbi:hypothetical protein [Hymenobacter glacieicola]|uniref:DUF4968 domain-containing protein n=1 Tax=Hymenobacter glacieicola TaxID=1562124 RepID=A0ABQ1X6D1_9BACT|nr:hypothetical protein [Hymenobacter glacieicola]GGG61990.1 hypothetical protein GCM10011378_42650 [Hymenobacter glacieicola]
MIKNYFSTFITGNLLLLSGAGLAQTQYRDYTQHFDRAQVLLNTAETLRGSLVLHRSEHATETITITLTDGSVRALSAAAVQKFVVQGDHYGPFDWAQKESYYYDFAPMRKGYYQESPTFLDQPVPVRLAKPNPQLSRVYGAYRWNQGNDYSDFLGYGFFEHLSAGPVVLLRHETLEIRHSGAMGGAFGGGSNRYLSNEREYYLGLPNGTVYALRDPKDDLLTYFSAYKTHIEQYAKKYKLSFKKPQELAYLVNYANSLAPQP